MSYTAGDVMNLAASLLNDTAKSKYSHAIQLPYLSIAQDELENELLLNSVVIENAVEDIDVDAGAVIVALPCNFFLPISLEEREQSSTDDDDFVDMTEQAFDTSMEQTDVLGQWNFRDNKINLLGSTADRTVRLKYRRTLSRFTNSANYQEEVAKAKNFLSFRTAGLCAEFIGRRSDIANSLNIQGMTSLEALVALYVKNSQGVRIRRKPFRVSYLNRRLG